MLKRGRVCLTKGSEMQQCHLFRIRWQNLCLMRSCKNRVFFNLVFLSIIQGHYEYLKREIDPLTSNYMQQWHSFRTGGKNLFFKHTPGLDKFLTWLNLVCVKVQSNIMFLSVFQCQEFWCHRRAPAWDHDRLNPPGAQILSSNGPQNFWQPQCGDVKWTRCKSLYWPGGQESKANSLWGHGFRWSNLPPANPNLPCFCLRILTCREI